MKGLRLVNFSGNLREFILVAKDPTYLEKISPFILSLNPSIETRNKAVWDVPRYQEMWVKGKISNAEYLLYLNFVGNRSFNDLSQYPVFPWVLTDYKNEAIHFEGKNPQFLFRDLSKPIGALNPDKLEQFRSKYFEIINKAQTHNQETEDSMHHLAASHSDKPYMYLSHYSTPGIALYYLIRQVPSYILTIQNDGYGGPPDRIFHDLSLSWYNGCMRVLADNKEFTPEFYLGDGTFLQNLNNVELGINH